MATTPQNQYDIPQGGYVSFDALSLRQLIVNRLNEQGTFTDQNFVGSNLASIIDIIAYSYNTLIYYLNKTSTESMFSEAQLYENINRIVKSLDYKPIGFQTSTLTFQASTSNVNTLPTGLYTIPRYSYFTVGNINYSFNGDTTFAKVNGPNTTEALTNVSQETFLYQGTYQEYPTYTAAGDINETVIIDTAGALVDHFNIDVYVKSTLTGVWSQYTPTASLYLENGTALKYEIRLNENQRYEIKFGNNINGLQLQSGDQVAVYYLQSDGANGIIGANQFTNSAITLYNTPQYTAIKNDIVSNQFNFIDAANANTILQVQNNSSSTAIQAAQTADDIRSAAPSNFRGQYRLVTTNDYANFVQTNFGNLISNVRVVTNTDYVSTYMKYFHTLGVNNPGLTDRALINQILYANSCNFNNVYLLVVPKSTGAIYNYLTPSQKQLIKNSISNYKTATSETVFIDPVYKAIAFGVNAAGATLYPPGDVNCIQLQITKSSTSSRSNQAIVSDVANIFTTYFNGNKLTLGQEIDLLGLTQQILSVDGVSTFYTARNDGSGVKTKGLSFYIWNPTYPYTDAIITSNNTTLNFFEFPFFNNLSIISNYIVVNN